jgi:hypothetical protein
MAYLIAFVLLFLATAGLRVDVTVPARPVVAWTALVVVLGAIFGKFAGAYAGARLRRLSAYSTPPRHPGEYPPSKGGPRRSEGPPPLHYGGRPMRRPGP